MKIVTKIESCYQCRNCRIQRFYTGDSFENVFEWFCLKESKKIALVEIFDKNPPIPDWCQLETIT